MLKHSTYKEKFQLLQPWMRAIVDPIKKEIRNEHLRKDWPFFNRYFSGKQLNKLSPEEMSQAYAQAISTEEHGEQIGEFLSNRWILKHSDLYHHFEQELSQVDQNFNELEMLDKDVSIKIMERAVNDFGAPKTYLFCILNSVVFPEEVFKVLEDKAVKEASQRVADLQTAQEQQAMEQVQRNYEVQIARLTDKYEKKLIGMQKKYVQDVESLKKQIATLQRKLNG